MRLDQDSTWIMLNQTDCLSGTITLNVKKSKLWPATVAYAIVHLTSLLHVLTLTPTSHSLI